MGKFPQVKKKLQLQAKYLQNIQWAPALWLSPRITNFKIKDLRKLGDLGERKWDIQTAP